MADCFYCHGSGEIAQTCTTCGGSGEIEERCGTCGAVAWWMTSIRVGAAAAQVRPPSPAGNVVVLVLSS